MKRLRRHLAEPVPVTALSLFRIGFALVTLAFLWELGQYRHMIFDPVPWLKPAAWPVAPLLLTAIAAEFLILIGLFTRVAAFVVWLTFTYVLGGHLGWYHAEWAFITVHFLLIFLPASESLSVASLIKARRSGPGAAQSAPTVPIGTYLVPVYLALGLTYADSVIWKLGSWHWREGLGVWRPMSTLSAAQFDLTPLLNVEPLMQLASWVTIVYELSFIFLMWFRRARVPLVLVGIGLHFGILIAFPIPIFALQSMLLLTLLVPNWPQWLLRKFRDGPEPAGVRLRRTLPSSAVVAGVGILTAAQLVITCGISVPAALGITPPSALATATHATRDLARPYFGVTTHDVFVAAHFDGNSRVYRLVDQATGKPLPIVNDYGMPTHLMAHDLFWCAWVFFNLRDDPTEDTVTRYAAGYLGPDKLHSDRRYAFDVQVKDFVEARHWRKNLLREAKTARWANVGRLTFDDGQINWTRERD